jgi:hypothetical protein
LLAPSELSPPYLKYVVKGRRKEVLKDVNITYVIKGRI